MRHHLFTGGTPGLPVAGSYTDAAFIATGPGRVRTGRRTGQLGAFPTYCRWASPQTFTPPFTVEGRMLIRSRLDTVWIEHENRAPTWDWRLCFLAFRDEDNNVVATVGGKDQPSTPGLTYQRNKLYGSNDPQWPGWERLERTAMSVPMGRWVPFGFDVDERRYRLHIDGRVVVDGTFRQPVIAAPVRVGFRFDFHDVELDAVYVDDHEGDAVSDWQVAPPFNMVRRDVVWPGETPRSSSGGVRPFVAKPADFMTMHYTGAGEWADFGDTTAEARAIQVYANHAAKPWEYNWIVDTEGNVVEYAGVYRAAHSGGENSVAHGVLLLLGVHEDLTDAQILAYRQLRWWLKECGLLDVSHRHLPHRKMPDAATICPGERIMARWSDLDAWWSPTPRPPQPPEDDDVKLYAATDEAGTVWVGNGVHRSRVPSNATLDVHILRSANGTGPQLVNLDGKAVATRQDVQGKKHPQHVIDTLGAVV